MQNIRNQFIFRVVMKNLIKTWRFENTKQKLKFQIVHNSTWRQAQGRRVANFQFKHWTQPATLNLQINHTI